jgi:hypothetical protein
MSKETLARFESATKEFIALARSMPTDQLDQVPEPGEWPAAYVIHHMADSDAHFIVRFFNILSVDKPAIIPFDEEIFPTALRYVGRSTEISLAALAASCAQLVDILSQLDESDWSRTGVHAERGELSLSALLELTTGHRVGHIDQLKK